MNTHILYATVCFLLTCSARNLENCFAPSDTNMENTFLSQQTLNQNPLLEKETYANDPEYKKETNQDTQQRLFNAPSQEPKTKPKSITSSEIFSFWALKNSLRSGNNKLLADLNHHEGICSNREESNKLTTTDNKMPSERRRFAKYPKFFKKRDSEYDDDLERSTYNDLEDMMELDRDQDYDTDLDGDYERDVDNSWFTGYKNSLDKKMHSFCKEHDREKGKNDRDRERDHEKNWCNEEKDRCREKDHKKDFCIEPSEENELEKDCEIDWRKNICEEINKVKDKCRERDKERDWCKDLNNDCDDDKMRENCEKPCKTMDRNKDRCRNRDRFKYRKKIKEKQKDRDRCGDRYRDRDRDRDRDNYYDREKLKMTRMRNRGNHPTINFDDLMNRQNVKANSLELKPKKIIKKRKTPWQKIFGKSNTGKKDKSKPLLGSTEVSSCFDKTLRLIENYKRLASTIIEYANDIEAALTTM